MSRLVKNIFSFELTSVKLRKRVENVFKFESIASLLHKNRCTPLAALTFALCKLALTYVINLLRLNESFVIYVVVLFFYFCFNFLSFVLLLFLYLHRSAVYKRFH